ncbi:hypothetical protein CLRAG_23770 [Clostridium ragsdalei P11]|uniref:Uncharacterized protein n=1 Tax=Clostridium ragsdalei P11 TaxID=1353534 RepID=A0A1A6ARG1_9CLOT|nr:hypothetical protein CLRAG_23770 [Clostridium ragsdalei P11]
MIFIESLVKKLIKLGTTVLDTDSIIKSSITLEGESLLEKFLTLEGSYYIHAHIRNEVAWPEESKKLLNMLIEKETIKVLSDKDLIEMLKESYTMPYRTFLSNLKVCCSIFNTRYYNDYYVELEKLDFKNLDIDEFLIKLKVIEDRILDDCKNNRVPSNLGELKTALMSAILYVVNNTQVNIFASDDRRARRCMVIGYSGEYHSLKALSVLGIFYILRDYLDKEKAVAYINKFHELSFKICDNKNNMIKKSGEDIIDLLYAGKLVLLKDGNMKLVH